MIPNGVSGQSLQRFFTEHFLVPLIFRGDPSNGRCGDYFGMEDDPSEEVIVRPSFPGHISLSGYKGGSLCVVGM